ncbi:MAG: MFS transporter [bacterium]
MSKGKRMKKKKLQSPYIWTFTTYFTEGFPYTIIRTVSSVFFRDMKVPLEAIGLTSLFGIPWIIKFLWGPQVDEYGSNRKWLISTQFILFLIMILVSAVIPFPFGIKAIVILFLIGSFVAATHDIAIDGYYMKALDSDGQAKFVGYRVMAYRIAMMTGTGIIVTVGTTTSWTLAFALATLLFGLFFLYHFFYLEEVEEEKKGISLFFQQLAKPKTIVGSFLIVPLIISTYAFLNSVHYRLVQESYPFLKKITFSYWIAIFLLIALIIIAVCNKPIKNCLTNNPDSFYSQAFISFVDREKIGIILAFIILFKAGEFMLSTMVPPFIVDLGIKTHYGWISSLIGLPASIVGALLGGWCISRFSLKKIMWPFILAQNLTNVIYMFLAFHLSNFVKINTTGIGLRNLSLVAGVHGFDQFAGGLGTAILMTYLMRLCHAKFKTAHYAIGSGLMNIGGLIPGILSGFIAARYGYGGLFGVSFLVSLPAMVLIPFLPITN